jgi:hypothetical protein
VPRPEGGSCVVRLRTRGKDRAGRVDLGDEVQIHQIAVLLGGGRRPLDVLPSLVELEIE